MRMRLLSQIILLLFVKGTVESHTCFVYNVRCNTDFCYLTHSDRLLSVCQSRICPRRLFSLSICLLSLSEELKRFAIILLRIEITHPFVHNGDCIVTSPSEMNPLEMLENENEPQTVLISNPWGNLESLTTICAFENSRLAHFFE